MSRNGWLARRCGSERGSCSRPGRVLEKPASWHGPRKDRRWAYQLLWSPEQIYARRLPVDFADDATMLPSAMKPFIKRCSFKVEARCAA